MAISTDRDPDEVIVELLDEARPLHEVLVERLATNDRNEARKWMQLVCDIRITEGHDELISAVENAPRIEFMGTFRMNWETKDMDVEADPHCLNDRTAAKLRAEKEELK